MVIAVLTYWVMNRFMFGFCALIISSCLWPSLPGPWVIPWLIVLACIFLRYSSLIAGGVFATAALAFFAQYYVPNEPSDNRGPINLRGEIISLVSRNGDSLSLTIRAIDNNFSIYSPRVQLFWPLDKVKAPEFVQPKVGQVWQWTVKPKSIVSVLNQGGFNKQKHRISQHVTARGKVSDAKFISDSYSLRQALIRVLLPVTKELRTGDILQALLLGDKQLISPTRWQSLRETGTGHLVAISGLHLSVVALWSYWLFNLLFPLCMRGFQRWLVVKSAAYRLIFNLSQGRASVIITALAVLLVVAGYSYLSGFAIPTQRAFIMLAVVVLVGIIRRFSSPWERLLWAMFLVLLFDPFAVLSPGFWLSFSALGVILYTLNLYSKRENETEKLFESEQKESDDKNEITNQLEDKQDASESQSSNSVLTASLRLQTLLGDLLNVSLSAIKRLKQKLLLLWAVQWRLSLVLGLIQGALFGGVGGLSLLINLVVVPWFSLVVIPLSLCCFLFWLFVDITGLNVWLGLDPVSLFYLANLSLQPFEYLLSLTEPLSVTWVAIPQSLVAATLFALIGGILICWHSGRSWRFLGAVLLLPILLSGYQHLSRQMKANSESEKAYGFEKRVAESWQLHLLDVGQGLSVVISHQGRAVIYDTGAAYGDDFSYAQRVVLPFLQAKGIASVDYLIISHTDNDHAGGESVIQRAFPQAKLIKDTPSVTGLAQPDRIYCRPKQLSWQGLRVELLGPVRPMAGNNGSCVVKVSDALHSVLLPGDIEWQQEAELVAQYSDYQKLKSDILIAPHHGSRTSSTAEFIDAVSPSLVLFAAGFANHYGFPKPDIVQRYQGIPWLVSGERGQISLTFDQSGMQVSTYRQDLAPFWYNRLFGFGTLAQSRVE